MDNRDLMKASYETHTWEYRKREAAISKTDNPYRGVRVPDKSAEAVCTDTPTPHREADSARPLPTSH